MALPPMDAALAGTIVTGGGPGASNAAHTANLDWQNTASGGITPVPTFAEPAFDKFLYLKTGKQSPLWRLMLTKPMITARQTLGRPDYQWAEIRPMPEISTTAGSATGGSVAIAVNNINMITPRATLRFFGAIQAEFWVTGVNTPAAGFVTGMFLPPVPTVAIPPGTGFLVCGPAYEQMNIAYSGPRTQEVWYRNYHQFFRHRLDIADMAKDDKYQMPAGGYWRWLVQQMLEPQHCTEVEKTLNFGIGGFFNGPVTPMGSPAGFLEGLYTRCVTQRHSMGNVALTRALLDLWLAPVFRDVTENETGWVGLLSARAFVQITNMFTLYELGTVTTHSTQAGLSITTYQHPTGAKIRLIRQQLYDFAGRRDLAMFVRLSPDTAQIINHYTHPRPVRAIEGRPPYHGSWSYAIRESNLTMAIKAEDENLICIEDIGGNP